MKPVNARTLTPNPVIRIKRRLQRSWERGGLPEIVRLSWFNVVYYTRRHVFDRQSRNQPNDFDLQFNVDTGGRIELSDLDNIQSRNYAYGILYQATPIQDFRKILDHLKVRYEDFVFIDFGSGKGRTLLLASEFPFRKVIGVEFSPDLHAIATANLERYRSMQQKCRNLASVCLDAADFAIPQDPGVYYFFHPFEAKVMQQVLNNIEKSLEACPRPVFLLYYNPQLAGLLDQKPFLRRYHSAEDYVIYEAVCARAGAAE